MIPGSTDDRELGVHFDAFVHGSRAVRIVVDVSPLSHPRTGIGNYIRGSLAGMAAAAGGRARAPRVRADEPAGAGRGSVRRSPASRST